MAESLQRQYAPGMRRTRPCFHTFSARRCRTTNRYSVFSDSLLVMTMMLPSSTACCTLRGSPEEERSPRRTNKTMEALHIHTPRGRTPRYALLQTSWPFSMDHGQLFWRQGLPSPLICCHRVGSIDGDRTWPSPWPP